LATGSWVEKLTLSAIYRDYAPAFSGTKGTPIALRIADPFQSHFSQNPRPIADQFSAFIRRKKISAVCARSSAKKRTLFAKDG
jgi:hypothetical protein